MENEDWGLEIVDRRVAQIGGGASIYRVFLLPGRLQFDLSSTPASHFGANSPKVNLIFGSSVQKPCNQPPSPS